MTLVTCALTPFQKRRNSTRRECWQSLASVSPCWWSASCVWWPTAKPSKPSPRLIHSPWCRSRLGRQGLCSPRAHAQGLGSKAAQGLNLLMLPTRAPSSVCVQLSKFLSDQGSVNGQRLRGTGLWVSVPHRHHLLRAQMPKTEDKSNATQKDKSRNLRNKESVL